MSLLKRTYTLPREAVEEFERRVAPGKRSAVVAEVLEDWLDQQEREAFRKGVIAGCQDMADVYLETAREFEPLEREVDRALDS